MYWFTDLHKLWTRIHSEPDYQTMAISYIMYTIIRPMKVIKGLTLSESIWWPTSHTRQHKRLIINTYTLQGCPFICRQVTIVNNDIACRLSSCHRYGELCILYVWWREVWVIIGKLWQVLFFISLIHHVETWTLMKLYHVLWPPKMTTLDLCQSTHAIPHQKAKWNSAARMDPPIWHVYLCHWRL